MNCPTCGSPDPSLHPSMQHGGEVEICVDDYHLRDTPSAKPYHAAVLEKRNRLAKICELENIKDANARLSARIVELETENNALKVAPARPIVSFTGNQAEALMRAFGGSACTYDVGYYEPHEVAPQEDGSPAQAGLYAYCPDYPEEGLIFLGAENADYEPIYPFNPPSQSLDEIQTEQRKRHILLNSDVLGLKLTQWVTENKTEDFTSVEHFFAYAMRQMIPHIDSVPLGMHRIGTVTSDGFASVRVQLDPQKAPAINRSLALFAAIPEDIFANENAPEPEH